MTTALAAAIEGAAFYVLLGLAAFCALWELAMLVGRRLSRRSTPRPVTDVTDEWRGVRESMRERQGL